MWCFRWFLALAVAWRTSAMYCSPDSCYDVLDTKRTDDAATIKQAYRKLSKQWHPDKNPNNKQEATAKFQMIATAYETLSDDGLREAYEYYLDHPQEHMYNKLRYYRVVHQQKVALWLVLLGLAVLGSIGQYYHKRERVQAFLDSPMLAQALEEEYITNCERGRHGYQTGEMTPEKKAVVKENYLITLSEDPDCPLYHTDWQYTFLPSLCYRWPVTFTTWAIWRIKNHSRIQREKAEAAAAAAKAEREEREAREAKEREEREKAEKKARNADYKAERERKEAEQKLKWLEEAEREEEERNAQEEAKKAKSAASGGADLIVTGKVVSVGEMRKKGHYLVEVEYQGDERVQIVHTSQLKIGQEVTVGLEGATLEDGKKAKRSKLAGEWSEGVIMKSGKAPKSKAPVDSDEDEAPAEAEAEDMPAADSGKEGKAKQRKGKKK